MAAEHAQTHPTPRAYFIVFLALMGLLVLTVLAAFAPLDRLFSDTARAEAWLRRITVSIALTIAVIKGLLIVLFFMHVRYAPRVTWAFAGAGFLWLGIMLTLTFSDYITRNHPRDMDYRGEPRFLSSQRVP
jgi:cytochrome c oxidase subunit 4